ncbi:transglycosylase SLT domain-containing protein [Acinetobacter baumannii]
MRIPQFNQQVNEQGMPNVRVQGGMSPGAAVDITSNQIDGVANLANTAANVYQLEVDRTDRTRVADAQNQLTELKYHLQNNKVDGYIHKKGADVVGFGNEDGTGFVDYYLKAYQDGVSEITAKLGNNRQRQMFTQAATKDAFAFRGNLQNYFVRENDTYQQSVYSASADRFIRNINENPADFASIDESRENLKASLGELMRIEGKSATEAENLYLKNVSNAHMNNLNAFVENGNLKAATMYRNKYSSEISLADSFKVDRVIRQKLEDQQVESLVNFAITGSQENSNPALNAPPQVSQAIAQELKGLTPQQMQNIKYNDQRLDVYTVHAAKEKGMEWAAPLLLGIRLSGEKSNNNQTSPKGAKSVMQFMPATWGDFNKNGQRDINNPADTIDASLEFVDWISKKYKTKDPMVIAAYYNGGDPAAKAVQSGKLPPASETRKYLERIDNWLSDGFGTYAKQPAKTREQAFEAVWNSSTSQEVKGKAEIALNRRYAAEDKIKKDRQDEAYSEIFNGIITGQFTYEQIPVNALTNLEPNQIKDLKSVSKATYSNDVKTDPTVYSMIMLNKDELFKGKPQSVLHQYADKLSPSDYKEATKMYLEVNNPKETDKTKDKKFLANDSTVASALKPYLNIIGITDTKNKNQLLHYNAVKSDLMQTLLEAEARNGGHLTWDQINRITLKNINNKVQITTSRPFFDDKVELNRVYAQVKSKSDMTDSMRKKIDDIFKKQGRNLGTVTDSEYLNAYYAMMRRGF